MTLLTRLASLSPLVLVLAGCAYQPVEQMPEVELAEMPPMPAQGSYDFVEAPSQNWWERYESAELNRLFDELEQSNLDLATSRERIEQARALLKQQRAESWPSLDVGLNERASRDFDASNTSDSSSLSFSAGYEVDLWASRNAADYSTGMQLIQSQQEYQSLRLQLQATLATAYFDYLALQQRLELSRQNMQASFELLELIRLRFEAGSASGIELRQQQNTYLSAHSSTLNLERALATAERTLAVLLGRESLKTRDIQAEFSSLTMPHVSLVQPAALLAYRPDIRLAETNLQIQAASLYQQQTRRWPGLSLGAGLGLDEVLSGGDTWVGSLAASLTMPLIDGGAIRSQIEAAESSLDIAEINYQQTVLTAMQETLEVLTELGYQQELMQVRQQEFANNRRLYDLSLLRYESGDTDFLNLLAAQRTWFNAQDSLVQAQQNQLQATVNIFRAMGVAPRTDSQ